MTQMLQSAIERINKLPAEEQDAIAALIMTEIEDEEAWAARFQATSDEQWDRMAESVRREIAAGDISPLDDVISPTA